MADTERVLMENVIVAARILNACLIKYHPDGATVDSARKNLGRTIAELDDSRGMPTFDTEAAVNSFLNETES